MRQFLSLSKGCRWMKNNLTREIQLSHSQSNDNQPEILTSKTNRRNQSSSRFTGSVHVAHANRNCRYVGRLITFRIA